METFVALLRGINLGTRNRVAMQDLRELVGSLGSEGVRTYLQSGNVIFRSRGNASDLVQAIEERIGHAFGLDVTVLVKTRAQLATIAGCNPFLTAGIEPSTLHVTFLAETPDPQRIGALSEKSFPPDRLRVVGQDVYLHCPDGYGRSKLSNAFLEKQLGVRATTRNWKTVTQLAELANE